MHINEVKPAPPPLISNSWSPGINLIMVQALARSRHFMTICTAPLPQVLLLPLLQVATVQAENKKLAEPLKKAKEELHRLKVT